MVRISKSPQERKIEILQAALELFIANGYEATSVGDIVNKVGVAKGLFYYYFASKEELYRAAMEYYIDEFSIVLQQIILDRSIPLMMRTQKVMLTMVQLFSESEKPLMNDLHKAERMDLHNRITLHVAQTLVDPLCTILNECNEQGLTKIKNPEYSATFIVFGVYGVLHGTEEALQNGDFSHLNEVTEIIASVLGISENDLMQL